MVPMAGHYFLDECYDCHSEIFCMSEDVYSNPQSDSNSVHCILLF